MNLFRKLIVITLFLLNSPAFASEKYCLKDGAKYDVHVFGETFEEKSQKKLAAKGLSDLRNKFKHGDKVRLFIHKKSSYDIAIDSCVPGCPEKKFMEELFSSECNLMVAKKDRQEFNNNFSLKIIANFKSETSDYDIFQSVQSLADVYKSTSQKDAIYSAISLIPKGIDPKNRNQLTELYVKKREALKFPTAFPKVKLIGNSIDQELIKFWKDIFQGKVEIEFDTY